LWHATSVEASVTYLQRTTTLTTSGLPCSDGTCSVGTTTTTVTDFSPFSNSMSYGNNAAFASQQSSLNSTEIQVNNSASASPVSDGSAESYFSVEFSLDQSENFDFNGSGSLLFQEGRVQIELTGPNGLDISTQTQIPHPNEELFSVAESGTLGPGMYTLVVDALASGRPAAPTATAQATLDLTPVPLPAAGLLFLSGLAPLGFLRALRRA
jgi:hypothetical protein